MPEPSGSPHTALEAAKNFVLLVRESAVSIAVVALLVLLALSPEGLRTRLEKAGIQSIKLPLVEIQTALKETEKQLASAKAEVETAQVAVRWSQDELAASKAQLEQVLRTANLAAAPRSQLQTLSGSLTTSRDQLTTSTNRLLRVAGALGKSGEDQRALIQRIEAVRK